MPPDNDDIDSIDLGHRIKVMRLRQRLSQRGLAKISKMAPATISLIERNSISPSASTLLRLADALNVPITAFFEPQPSATLGLHFVSAKNRRYVHFASTKAEYLGAGGQLNGAVVPCLLTLDPHAESGPLFMPRGETFVYCLEGRIRFAFDQREYVLEEGDTLLFATSLRHQWSNPTDQTARMLVVLCNVGDVLNDYIRPPESDPNG